jgi:hypothetical protein
MKTENPRVGGSIPPLGTIFKLLFLGLFPIQGWKQKNKVTQIGVTSVLLDGYSDLRGPVIWGLREGEIGGWCPGRANP